MFLQGELTLLLKQASLTHRFRLEVGGVRLALEVKSSTRIRSS